MRRYLPRAQRRTQLGFISCGPAFFGPSIPASPFNPASLFGGSDHGLVIDFTDATKLFQSSAGTTAVVNPTDPIGYATDSGPNALNAVQATSANRPLWSGTPKTLGSELVGNGRFNDGTVWTTGSGWSIASGVATKTAGTASNISQSVSLTAGTAYMIHYSITRTAGGITAQFTGGTTVGGVARTTDGSYTEIFIALASNATINFAADSAFAGTLDNVSVKAVTAYSNMGAKFDGALSKISTPAVNLSGSSKGTLIYSCLYSQETSERTPIDVGNYFASTPGAFAGDLSSRPRTYLEGASSSADVVVTSSFEGAHSLCPMLYLHTTQVDTTAATTLLQIINRTRGVQPAQTATGGPVGSHALVNGVVSFGGAVNGIQLWKDMLYRAVLINRVLTAPELASAEKWVRAGMAICCVLGDSTSAPIDSGSSLPVARNTSSFCGGMITGAADVSNPGDKIADQTTAFNNISDYSALQAVIIQIGLNDINTYVGNASKTAAQVIADLQTLVTHVIATVPATCKVYVSQLTPAKGWLGAVTGNPANCYSAWQAMNTAIAGGGGTPITGATGYISSHVASLDDGSGNLNPIYDFHNDHVHPSNEARFIIAQAWRTKLVADGLLV